MRHKSLHFPCKESTSHIFTVSGGGTVGDLSLLELKMRGGESASQTKLERSREWSGGFRERWSKGNEYRLWGSSPRDHAIKTTGPNYTVPHRERTPLFPSPIAHPLFHTYFLRSVSHTLTYPQRTPRFAHISSHESSSNTAGRKMCL